MNLEKIMTKLLIPIALFIFGLIYLTVNNVYAASSYLIDLGTGEYHITVTKDTTIEDISKILGEPKLVTESPFGGNAYTFYTDDEYSNYLYIETTDVGKIISFGSVDPTYKTSTYSYNDAYPYQASPTLQGLLVNNNSKIVAGVYYNRDEVNFYSSNNMFDYYESTYLSNPTKYLKEIGKQATVMYNAFSTVLGKPCSLEFNEEYFYINEQLKEFSSSLREYILDSNVQTNKFKMLGTVSKNIEINTSNAFLINPMNFARGALGTYNNFGEKTNVFIDYDVERKLLYAMAVTDDLLDKTNELPLTALEEEKIKDAQEWYQKSAESMEEDGDVLFEVEPVYSSPQTMLAGKLLHSKELAVLYYLNAIRAGGALPPLEYNEDAYTTAQHIANYMAYRYEYLGLDIEHLPPQVEGLSDEYYYTALGGGKGFAENLSRAALQTTPKAMLQHMNNLLDDRATLSSPFGHRTTILKPNYKYFGFGISSIMAANEFSGYQDSDVEVVAWPANGITAMEGLIDDRDTRFDWTVQFVKNYKVQDDTTATVKLLNDGTTWEFEKQEKTSSYWYQTDTDTLQSLNNKVVISDSSIYPQEGHIYEITLHNVLDERTNKLVDYTYRTVFTYLDSDNSPTNNTISNVEINNPTELEYDVKTGSYKIPLNEEVKLNASIDKEEAVQKILTWSSSNPDAVSVTQNGTLVASKESNIPVIITVYNEISETSDTISILPTDQYAGKTPISQCTFSDIVNKDYSPKEEEMEQDLVIKDGDYTLKEGIDYETTYEFEYDEDAKEKIRLTVTGIGDNYTESKQFVYSMKPIDMKMLDIVTTTTYNGKMQSPSITFDAPLFMIMYNHDNILDASYTSIVPEYKDAGTYTYAISARPREEYKYNRYNRKDLQFTINKLNLVNVTVTDVKDYKYTGKDITPEVTLTYDGYTLKEGTDYNLSYKNNKNPGTATIVLEGINNCEGTITKEFEITQSNVYDISFDYDNINVPLNTSTVIKPVITPNFDVNITYTSSNPSVATIDQTGTVTALKKGTTTITARATNGKSATITVTVTDYLMGDMNHSGRIDITDITVFVKVLYGMIDTNDYYLTVGDMNHSGRLDITDITVLVKTLYGLI